MSSSSPAVGRGRGRGRGWLGKFKPQPCLLSKEDVVPLPHNVSDLSDKIARGILATQDDDNGMLETQGNECKPLTFGCPHLVKNIIPETESWVDAIPTEDEQSVFHMQRDEKTQLTDTHFKVIAVKENDEQFETDEFLTPPRSLTNSPARDVDTVEILDEKEKSIYPNINGHHGDLDEKPKIDLEKKCTENNVDLNLSELTLSNKCNLLPSENNFSSSNNIESTSQEDMLKAVYAEEFIPNRKEKAVFAKEFIPSQHITIGDEKEKAVFAEEFIPRQNVTVGYEKENTVDESIPCQYVETLDENGQVMYLEYNECAFEEEQYKYMDSNEEQVVLGVLNDVILTLKEDPGDFDVVIGHLTEHLVNFVTQEETLKQVVNTIIGEAIKETNFAFMAGKLSQHFDESKAMELEGGVTFRKVFFNRCQEVFTAVKELCKDVATCKENKDQITRTALLFGELLCTMKLKNQINPLYKYVIEQFINMFLDIELEEMIITLTRLLKLVGPELDVDRPKDVEAIFEKVKDFYLDPKRSGSLSVSVKQNLWRVYKLHSRDWDRPTSPVISPGFKQDKFHFHAEAPQLERQRSHEKTSSRSSPVDWGEYYDGDDNDVFQNHMHMNGPDEEECDAFEEFLRASGQL